MTPGRVGTMLAEQRGCSKPRPYDDQRVAPAGVAAKVS